MTFGAHVKLMERIFYMERVVPKRLKLTPSLEHGDISNLLVALLTSELSAGNIMTTSRLRFSSIIIIQTPKF